jgi:hypothetical protein
MSGGLRLDSVDQVSNIWLAYRNTAVNTPAEVFRSG